MIEIGRGEGGRANPSHHLSWLYRHKNINIKQDTNKTISYYVEFRLYDAHTRICSWIQAGFDK